MRTSCGSEQASGMKARKGKRFTITPLLFKLCTASNKKIAHDTQPKYSMIRGLSIEAERQTQKVQNSIIHLPACPSVSLSAWLFSFSRKRADGASPAEVSSQAQPKTTNKTTCATTGPLHSSPCTLLPWLSISSLQQCVSCIAISIRKTDLSSRAQNFLYLSHRY